MANDSNCNFETVLSLDKAVLVERGSINALGSQELVLRYNGIASAVREDCIEYLYANRKTLDAPNFSFKTYEGLWYCVSISYNEKQHIIEQTFKIDSSIGDLGTLPAPLDYDTQFGDVSRISDGVTIEKAYYWRMVDPTIIELPAAPIEGQIWSKTANDNGDGTYDVIVSREIAEDQEALSQSTGSTYSEETIKHTNTLPYIFASQYGGDPLVEISEPDAEVGEVKRIDNTPLENGLYRSEITTRTAINIRIPDVSYPTLQIRIPSDYVANGCILIIGINRTLAEFDNDKLALQDFVVGSPAYVVSPSLRFNEYGLYDYTLSGRI